MTSAQTLRNQPINLKHHLLDVHVTLADKQPAINQSINHSFNLTLHLLDIHVTLVHKHSGLEDEPEYLDGRHARHIRFMSALPRWAMGRRDHFERGEGGMERHDLLGRGWITGERTPPIP